KPKHEVVRTAMPKDVKAIEICWPLGRSVQETEAGLCHRQRKGFALASSIPPTWPDRDARVWNAGQLELQIDVQTGLRLSADCKSNHQQKIVHIARWPSLTTPWLSSNLREKTRIPALAPDCSEDALASMETLQIDGPAEKSTLARAPNSTQPISAEFRALGTQQKVKWLVNGQWVADTSGSQMFVMKFDNSGPQRITALTDAGAWDEMSVYVLK
ncbi:MAG: penicillin-binding protein 1C, partial [Arenimonas sp.]